MSGKLRVSSAQERCISGQSAPTNQPRNKQKFSRWRINKFQAQRSKRWGEVNAKYLVKFCLKCDLTLDPTANKRQHCILPAKEPRIHEKKANARNKIKFFPITQRSSKLKLCFRSFDYFQVVQFRDMRYTQRDTELWYYVSYLLIVILFSI